MANRIVVDKETINALVSWGGENKRLLKINRPYFHRFELFVKSEFGDFVCYAEWKEKKAEWKINIKFTYIEHGKKISYSLGKLTLNTLNGEYINSLPEEEREEKRNLEIPVDVNFEASEMYKKAITSQIGRFSEDTLNELVLTTISLVTAIFTSANAYLTYANIYEDRPVVILGKNDGEDKVIVFRQFEGRTYAINTTAHRSPEGVFSVRGHFRRYPKTGKVIWIDEYLKELRQKRSQPDSTLDDKTRVNLIRRKGKKII